MAAKPIDFMYVHPWSSVTGKCENESLACSIMATKVHSNNNSFYDSNNEVKETTYKEYLDYKKSIGVSKDNSATEKEFDKINEWCQTESTAALFAPGWKLVKNKFAKIKIEENA